MMLLTALLLVSVLLSLRAGSYNTPTAELLRGIFGKSADKKVNLVIRNNRLPRICTAIVAGAGLDSPGRGQKALPGLLRKLQPLRRVKQNTQKASHRETSARPSANGMGKI